MTTLLRFEVSKTLRIEESILQVTLKIVKIVKIVKITVVRSIFIFCRTG